MFKHYGDILENAGIWSKNIQNAIEIPWDLHDFLHGPPDGRGGEWNRRWREFFEKPANKKASKAKIAEFRDKLMKEFGVSKYKLKTYRKGKCVDPVWTQF
jgi:hypothetical protein